MAHSDESIQSQDTNQTKVVCSVAEGDTSDKDSVSNQSSKTTGSEECHNQARSRLRRKYCAYFGK